MRSSSPSPLASPSPAPASPSTRRGLSSFAPVAVLAAALSLSALAPSCAVDTAPDGLRATPPGDGPTVVFDLARAPLPELPLPNDVATFADPTSRTGLRVNVSAIAPTALERRAREDFASLEGFSTFAPVTVAFSKGAGTDARDAALDLRDVVRRTRDDGWDFRDDPFYVVDLETGVPVPLDLGQGNFPLSVADTGRYWENDPRRTAETLLFETAEEGLALPQGAYTPAADTDFDGVLDHPNRLTLAPTGRPGVDDLLSFFDRETDSLVLRPLVPLREKARYAVVLTDRLRAPDGAAVRSPFPAIHHPEQRAQVARVREILEDRTLARYYGDLAGSGLDHVAFAWSFTTAPTTDDLLLLRDGLHQKGPFARLGRDFPARAQAFRAAGLDDTGEDVARLADPRCAGPRQRPYVVRIEDLKPQLRDVFDVALGDQFGGVSDAQVEELFASLDELSYVVIGEYESPYFLGTPSKEDPNERFRLDFRTGEGRVGRDRVQFWLFVPKKKVEPTKPAPTVLWYHGSSLFAAEGILRAGYFAKQGLATFAINLPGHGLPVSKGIATIARNLLAQTCLTPWVRGIEATRAYDLNGDGEPDSGGYLWTAHAFHSRDNVRQPVIDGMQAVRVLRAFGTASSGQDYDGDGAPNLLGDFDGDGVADVGGPEGLIAAAGNSFGGIAAMVHGAVDPQIAVTAPISGGGGLFDVASRSSLTADLVMQQTMTPLVVTVPSAARRPENGTATTRCQGEDVSVRFVVNDLMRSREVEIACLRPDELAVGADVVLTNLANGEVRCGRVGPEHRSRVPIPASLGDRLDVQVYPGPGAVTSYGTCALRADAPPGRRIATYEQAALAPTRIPEGAETCDQAEEREGLEPGVGCAQFQGIFYPVGSPLFAPQEGLGLTKGSPDLRRLVYLVQTAVDAGDPVNFAPLYLLRPPRDPDGRPMPPRPIVTFNTVGDPLVPVSTGHTFARAAGALPFLAPDAAQTMPELSAYVTPAWLWDTLGGRTPNRVLLDNWVVEGTARLERTRADAACRRNSTRAPGCPTSAEPGCRTALFDADWLAEGADQWAQPHLATPLRLARDASVPATLPDDVARAWRPRERGKPFGLDADAWTPGPPLVGLVNAYNDPRGVHVWALPDSCKAFDDPRYYNHLLARFVATRGTDLLPLSKPATHRCLEDESCPFFLR